MRWLFGTKSEAGPSTSRTNLLPEDKPQPSRWEKILTDEEAYQSKIYPTPDDIPSCMTLLDEFLMCYPPGPQFRSIYRYGETSSCNWKWADFKYCLSMKSEDMEARRQLWVKRRAEWWARRRFEGSSEDIWDVRAEPLRNFPPVEEEVIASSSTVES